MSIAKPPLSDIWAKDAPSGATGIEDPGGLKDTGWTAESACPPFSWMNWILNKLDSVGRYLLARGIPDYDASETYRVGDRVQYSTVTYFCLGTTTGNVPTNASYWETWAPRNAVLNTVIDARIAASTAAYSTTAISSGNFTLESGVTASGYILMIGIFKIVLIQVNGIPSTGGTTISISGALNAVLNGHTMSAIATPNFNQSNGSDNYYAQLNALMGDADHVNWHIYVTPFLSAGHTSSVNLTFFCGT